MPELGIINDRIGVSRRDLAQNAFNGVCRCLLACDAWLQSPEDKTREVSQRAAFFFLYRGYFDLPLV